MKKSVLSKTLTKSIVGVTLLTGVVAGGIYNHDTKVVEANETTLKDSIKTLSSIYDKDGVFFTKSYNEVEKTLNQLKSVPNDLDDVIIMNNNGKTEKLHKNLNEEVKVATKKLDIWNKINTIYNKEIDLSKKDNNLVADVSKVDDLKELNIENNETTEFEEQAMFYIKLANEQKQDFENAKEALGKVYKDNKVVSTNKKDIDSAKDSINKIKDLELKKSLLKELEVTQKQYEKEEQERVAKEKAEAEKAEQERIAKEKAEAEKAEQERIAKEKAEAEKAEQERIAKEKAKQEQVKIEQETVKEEKPNESNSQITAPQTNNNSAVSQTQSIPSSGVYINGISSPIGTYNQNGGQVPIYTNMAYLWAIGEGVPNNYYLIDYSNSVGLGVQVIALQTGDNVYINGHKYTVTGNQTVYPGQSTDTLDWNHSAFLQTCYSNADGGPMKLVYLD